MFAMWTEPKRAMEFLEKVLHELIRFDVIYVCIPTPVLPFRGKTFQYRRVQTKKNWALSVARKPWSFKSFRNLRRQAFFNLSGSEWLSQSSERSAGHWQDSLGAPPAKQKICFLSFSVLCLWQFWYDFSFKLVLSISKADGSSGCASE